MSKAKQQAYQNTQHRPQQQQQYAYAYPPPSSSSFAWGFFLGQLTLAAILFIFIKFFIFGESPSADERASARAAARRQRTLSHTRQRTFSTVLRSNPAPAILKPRADGGLTVQKILEKTYYHVSGHQPESLDWFNVLVAQTIAQLRADAQEDEGVLDSLTNLMNNGSKPSWMDDIRVTEISLGEEFPIFSNCRVIPVDEHGVPIRELTGKRGERLQARMDVDLSDVLTLGVETKLVLNWPKPFVMVLPVALAVSVVRFSGTLSLSFSPSSHHPATAAAPTSPATPPSPDINPSGHSPTTLTFTFLDDYRLDLSIRSLIGSRSRLQDVPKIAQLIEARIHQWFDDRCVEPRFQQIVLPSLWPRMKNTRGGAAGSGDGAGDRDDAETAIADDHSPINPRPKFDGKPGPLLAQAQAQAAPGATNNATSTASPVSVPSAAGIAVGGPHSTAEQRTRDWAERHSGKAMAAGGRGEKDKNDKAEMSGIELAGLEMREAEDRARRRENAAARSRLGLESQAGNLRLRSMGGGGEGS